MYNVPFLVLFLIVLPFSFLKISASTKDQMILKQTKLEGYKDILDKAMTLGLQQDRYQALVVLSKAYEKENLKKAVGSSASQEILLAFKKISQTFFKDQTQQLYELSLSLLPNDTVLSNSKIVEALRLEPDHFFLIYQQIRFLIRKGQCSVAEDQLSRWETFIKLDPNLALLKGQVNICLKKWKQYEAWKKQYFEINKTENTKGSTYFIHWLILDLQLAVFEKNRFKATDTLNMIRNIDSQFPEIHYWDWKLDDLNKMNNKAAADNYVRRCRLNTTMTYRKYLEEPFLCSRLSEVESASH